VLAGYLDFNFSCLYPDNNTCLIACKVQEEAIGKALAPPSEVVTDAFQAYSEAIRKAFPRGVMHIQGLLNGPINNDEIERHFRTVKQRFRSIYSFGSKYFIICSRIAEPSVIKV